MKSYRFIRKILFLFEPERAHSISLWFLDMAYRLGLLGLAAGLDKNGDHIDSLAACGFGFIEIGTVTPKAQMGNPRPRLFRLVDDEAIINRMGFNNHGVEHLVQQVKQSKRDCVLGINIGKNRDTPLSEAISDYQSALSSVYPYADYVTINISSPNTPGLRDLQHGEDLENLLKALKHDQAKLQVVHHRYVPLVVKIAPDLEEDEIMALAATFTRYEIDGIIATNTTNDRPGLTNALSNEQGGLSGKPLNSRSDAVLSSLVSHTRGNIPIIAVGGIFSAQDAKRKMELGASLVQIYTGFIFEGPALVRECASA